MKPLFAVLISTVALLSCDLNSNPMSDGSLPAGKAMTGAQYHIEWECGASEWTMPADSTWSLFYRTHRFFTDGQRLHITEYIDGNTKRVYWVEGGFFVNANTCRIQSGLIDNDEYFVRVYQGDVDWIYRSLPNYARLVLDDGAEEYHIARYQGEGANHIDYNSLYMRTKPEPPMLTSVGNGRYYLPFNFSQTALDTLDALPDDDRAYLDGVIVGGAVGAAVVVEPQAEQGSEVAPRAEPEPEPVAEAAEAGFDWESQDPEGCHKFSHVHLSGWVDHNGNPVTTPFPMGTDGNSIWPPGQYLAPNDADLPPGVHQPGHSHRLGEHTHSHDGTGTNTVGSSERGGSEFPLQPHSPGVSSDEGTHIEPSDLHWHKDFYIGTHTHCGIGPFGS